MSDRRQSDRRKTYLGGTIVFNSNGSTINCLVRNLSANGAMIELDWFSHPPAKFYFETGKRAYWANIAWRTARKVGLLFVDGAGSAPELVPIEWARRLHRSKAERLQLLRQVRDLTSA
jgi:hypothetical protein